MVSIASLGGSLEWRQPQTFGREFELRAGDEVLATLRLPSWFSSVTEVQTNSGVWLIEEMGCVRQRVVVRQACKHVELAAFEPNWKGCGPVYLNRRRKLRWEATNLWASGWRFVDDQGNQPVVIKSGVAGGRWRDRFKQQATVLLNDVNRDQREVPLLATLGWYLMMRRQHRLIE